MPVNKRISVVFFLLFLPIISCKTPPVTGLQDKGFVSPLRYNQWKLVWHDEFNGTRVDTNKWSLEVNDWGGGNEELQYYTSRPENAYIDRGMLVIAARKEHYKTRHYTSARLNTRYKGDWKYGRFDIRARFPRGWGLCPAIWMLPTDNCYGKWPAGGEIDIAEVLGRAPAELHSTVHFGSTTPQNRPSNTGKLQLTKGDFSEEFHVFSVEWEPHVIRWYLDNELHHTAQVTSPLNERYHLLLNLAVGGKWPGLPQSHNDFPALFAVDYVRVFERSPKGRPLQGNMKLSTKR
jgi:beta-glucanase (GH16 family)